MLLEQLLLISIEKLMNYMDLDGFLRFLGQGAGRPVVGCGGRVLPLIYYFSRRIEVWKLLSSMPGLMSWLVDLAGLD